MNQLYNIFMGSLATLITAGVIGAVVMLRDLHHDVGVTQALLEEHKEAHMLLEAEVFHSADRVHTLEINMASYHGVLANER